MSCTENALNEGHKQVLVNDHKWLVVCPTFLTPLATEEIILEDADLKRNLICKGYIFKEKCLHCRSENLTSLIRRSIWSP